MTNPLTGQGPIFVQPKFDYLIELFNKQRRIQELAYGKDPYSITDPVERIQFIKDMSMALQMELGEMLDETGWKPWATSNHVNEEAMQGELADIFLFFINLCMASNASPEVIAEKTLEKMDRNLKRQVDGYDGIAGKCYLCRRALDDVAVDCVRLSDYSGWCGQRGPDGSCTGHFNIPKVN